VPSTSLWISLLARPEDQAHLVQFYRDLGVLGCTVSLYLGEGLDRGEAAVVIATPDHWNEFRKRLEDRGLDCERLQEDERLTVKDADRTLDLLMRGGMPDAVLFRQSIGPVFSHLSSRGYPQVRAYGEMVSLLWRRGQHEAAVRLEILWNEIGRTQRFTLLCAYEGDALAPEFHGRPAHGIYEEHSHLVPPEDYDRLTAAVDQAMEEVLGTRPAAALKPIIAACNRRLSVLPGAQTTLLWLQSHLPEQVDDVLDAARRRYADGRER
jgi:hypothetical protein